MLLSQASSLKQWEEMISSACGEFIIPSPGYDQPIIGSINKERYGQNELMFITSNMSALSARCCAPERGICIGYQVAGNFILETPAGISTIYPGDIFLLDATRKTNIRTSQLYTAMSVTLPRNDLTCKAASLINKFSQSCASSRLLSTVMGFFANQPKSSLEQANDHLHLNDTILTVLGSASVSDALDYDNGLLMIQAQRLINRNLATPELSPRFISAQLKVPLRNLYRAFASTGLPVARYIQKCRLEKIAQDLVDDRYGTMSITAISYRWGFNDGAHFSKVFKQLFGVSPREYRKRGV